MKLNKKVLGLVLAGMLSVGMVGCGNNETEIQESQVKQEENSEFNEYNILSFSEIEVDEKPIFDDSTYIHFNCDVTNNSDKTIKTVTVYFSFYDENGNILSSTYPQDPNSILSNQSFNITGLYDSVEYDVKEIKVTGYSYYIGDNYYQVDLVGEVVEVWE